MTSLHARLSRFLIVLFAAFAFVALPAAAHAQSATGALDGIVVDQQNAVLPGVTITVTAVATGVKRSTVTDDKGMFRNPLLPVGDYEVLAELPGFKPQKQTDIHVMIGQSLTLRIEMAVGGVVETVTVAGSTPVVETSRTQVSSTVGEVAVQNLPVNGRNFIDFALLTPGVTKDTRTGDISFAGQRGTLNSLVVDGADSNNTFFGQTAGRTGSGRAPYQFSQDAVKEFQVNSNSFSAEYGRAGGAVINVVTKSGTNDYRGSMFEFFRDKSLNAINAINKINNLPKSPYRFNQFGGTIGGPIRRSRDFFFFNYDGQRNNTPNTVVLGNPANTPTDPLTQQGLAILQSKGESWERRLDQDVFLIKTDHTVNDNNRLSFRYNHQNFTGQGFENGGTTNALEHTGASIVKTRTFNASYSSIVTPAMFNELRFQLARDEEPGEANSADPEAVVQQSGSTVLTIGRNNFSPRETTIKRWQIADTLTWLRGDHKFKGGFDFQFDDILNRFPGFFSGSYTFRSLASFAAGRPNGANESYSQNFAGEGTTGPNTNPNIQEYSFFVQDEWRPIADVTVNLGLRYDLMKTAAPPVRNPDAQLAAAGIDTSRLDTDANNLGPRLGVAWAPAGKKFVVRGGFGVFYGRTPSIMLGTAHSNNGVNIIALTFTGDAVPTWPNNFSSIPAGGTAAKPTIFYIQPDFQNARLMQGNLAAEWEILPDTSLTVTYLSVSGSSLPRSIDRNLGSLGSRNFTVAGTGEVIPYHFFSTADRPYSNFGRVIAFESSAESSYNGVTFELNRRFARHMLGRLAYTIGKVTDTVPDATAVVPNNAGDDGKYASNPADFGADRTYGNTDQRQRFVLSGVYETNGLAEGKTGVTGALIRNWSLSGIFTAASGQPFTARVGAVDLNGDGNTRNDIAPGTSRNQFRYPTQVTMDLRVARDLPVGGNKVQVIWEAFNLFNRSNFNFANNTYYSVSGTTLTPSTTFGTPTGSAGERIMQLAVKFIF
ncbi:MAG TPA: carboxypeptidase regulatory-like domain-containing protein [Vicinamibacterales bacterium]|nr:carboxypeptidase regulatory-like domain-containing protein [Vicinamibacterales bacterium]